MNDIVEIKDLHNVTVTVRISGGLTFRLKVAMLFMRIAFWIASIGGVEFIEVEEDENNE